MKKIARLMTLALVVFALASCEDVPSPFGTVTPPKGDSRGSDIPPTGTGTATDPFNVQKAIDFVKELGADVESETALYVKGKVLSISEISASYGNASFILSDDTEGTNKFTAYRVKGFNNQKITDEKMIKVGDDVIICGKIVNYKGNTPETVQNTGYIYSVNGKTGGDPAPTGEAKGTGTQADPFNIAAAIAKCKEIGTTASTEKYYVKGIVVKGGTVSGGFGNVTFDMGDTKDATTTFKAFQVAGTDGEKLADGYTVNAGDEVVVYGPIYNYQGNTPETSGKSAAQIVTINGKKTSEGSGGTPSSEVKAVTIAEFNAAAESTDIWYQLTGTIKSLKEGDKYGNFNLEDATGSVYVYGLLSEKGGAKQKFQELVAAQGLQAGTKITIIGNRSSYNGQIQVANAYFVKVEDSSDTPGGGESGASSITVAMSSLGVANGVEVGTKTLTDGTVLTFDKGSNNNAPKYYDSGTAVRMYPNNSVTVTASKKIASIKLTCSANNAEGKISASKGTIVIEGMTVNLNGIDDTTTTITNSHTGTGAASQLRIASIEITYAK
ncbi:hypothetical protein SAMN04487851_10348 [Prevotella sp. tc2-28]|jgi:RPA family protein|uniref:hypothetical protein n=1 Tax=Prevotella sp. tc2-28 TaxID=1761888 RepID=UPI00089B3CEA|nr:hypothetical protein [Prevotella sp. tc2-28]SEA16652.1 hypothetical protein SAMN04487851_10348 [Prevotella sp. tc2-28]